MATRGSNDRRVRRTRAAIDEACLRLMRERRFDRATVAQIAQEADISRATFYLHYEDKSAWVRDYLNRLLARAAEKLGDEYDPLHDTTNDAEAVSRVFICFEEDFELYSLMLTYGGPELLRSNLIRFAMEDFKRHDRELPFAANDAERDMAVNVLASAVAGLLVWWVENNRPIPLERVVELMQRSNGFLADCVQD